MPALRAAIERRRLATILITIAAITCVVAFNLTPIFDSDFWIQLKIGDLIRKSGSIPATYLMTYTEAANVEYVEAHWLACLLWSHLFEINGYNGMIVIKCAFCLCIFALIVLLARQVDRDSILAIALASLAMLGANFRVLMRPELVAFVFALINLNLLQVFVRTGRPAWLLGLAPTSILWANFHPSFLVGFVFVAAFAAGEVIDAAWAWMRHGILPDQSNLAGRVGWLVAALLAVVALSLINPYGIGLFEPMSRAEGNDFIRANVWEWQPIYHPRFFREPFLFVFVAIVGIVLISGIVGRKKLRATPLLLVLGFLPLAISAIRHVPWFEFFAVFFLAHTLGHTAVMRRWRVPVAGVATMVLLAGSWIAFEHGNTRGRRTGFVNGAPLNPDVIAFIAASDIEGNVFHSYSYGDQLAYHFYPRIRVAMDTRMYSEKYYTEYRSMTGDNLDLLAPPAAFRDYLERYDVRTIVSTRMDVRAWLAMGHYRALDSLGFKVVYTDPKTVVLRR
jgi:hypothetical protein